MTVEAVLSAVGSANEGAVGGATNGAIGGAVDSANNDAVGSTVGGAADGAVGGADDGALNGGGEAGPVGILLSNLGTPDAPTPAALKPYLKQFLSDRRVVDLPRWLWLPVLHCIVLRTRPATAAQAYAKIWTEDGSPLRAHTQAQAAALADALRGALVEPTELKAHQGEGDYPGLPKDAVAVEYGFRYGQPSIADALDALIRRGARKVLVLPLYPQYAAATVGSTFDAVAAHLGTLRWVPALRFVAGYHDHPKYIAALADSIRAFQAEHGAADRLLFSYHGILERNRDSGDPYFHQCHATTQLTAAQLGLEEGSYMTAFQSRFGPEEWLKPYTDDILPQWAADGARSVQVICPGFAADCLETLEEVDMRYRELFLNAGGNRFDYIPALNSSPWHVEMMTALAAENLHGWV